MRVWYQLCHPPNWQSLYTFGVIDPTYAPEDAWALCGEPCKSRDTLKNWHNHGDDLARRGIIHGRNPCGGNQ